MQIIVKVLQGQQCTLEVPGNATILNIKQMICATTKIPVTQQKLLLTGRPLSDDKRLCDYPNISDGSRLNLVVSKNVTAGGDVSTISINETDDGSSVATPMLLEATYNFLNQFYSDQDSRKIADEFMKEFNKSVASLSLDDIERIATLYLEDESPMVS